MSSDSLFMRDLIQGFESEAKDLVDAITKELFSVEKGLEGVDRTKAYDRICRSFHTLKGSAATCGLTEVSQLSHRLEDVVAPFKGGGGALAPETVDLLLQGMDVLLSRVHLHCLSDTPPPPDPAEWGALMSQIQAAVAGSPAAGTAPSAAPAPKPVAEDEAVAGSLEGSWKVDSRQVGRMMQEVERLREVRLRLSDQSRILGRALQDRRFQGTAGRGDLEGFLHAVHHGLVHDAEETANLVDSLEEHLKDIALLSFDTIAQPLHRTVRDLCRTLGKQAELSVTGGEIRLDRRVLEGLKGPLVHLIRNAIDHGLETPEARDAAGKHREGALVVRAEQQGNLFFLEISDDGAGIDAERIRRAAGERQMFSPEELARMTDAQLRNLLFHSGFSTKREVTSVSGRGVGLDVVKSQVAEMKGTVEVESKAGQGTRFLISLPVELGSSPVLLLRVGTQRFGLPMLAAQNVVRAHPESLRFNQGRWELQAEGRTLPLVDLGGLLRLRLPQKPRAGQPLLLIPLGEKELALAVDEVLGDESLVLHPLPPEFANVEAFQGAGLLPSGELLLILKTHWLGQAERSEDPFEGRLKALVVDDSLTARAMHRNMLESAGYLVHGAVSARQGLELLETSTYDVVLCDVAMEGMDGLAFTRIVKADPRTRQLPVILVSARDEEKDLRRYEQGGADAFLSKKDCSSGRLLDEVAKLVQAPGRRP